MSSLYIIVVAVVVAAHFAFMRWPRTIVLHVLAVIWGFLSISLDLPCPLTYLERWARARAGMAPLPSDGFVARVCHGRGTAKE